MPPGPTHERLVGGPVLRVLTVVRPPKRRLRAYAALAPKAFVLARTRARQRRLRALPIAVTGSVGKTTTKNLLAAALATAGPTVANAGGANRARALADTVARADATTEFLVQEIGVAHAGARSLDELVWALEPRVAVITRVLGDHLESFGTLDDIAAEKGKAVAALPASGLAVLNADDPRVRAMAALTPARVVFVGRSRDAAVRIDDATADAGGRLQLRLSDGQREHSLALQLIGTHWALATALAFAAATRLGADPAAAIDALEAVSPTGERLSLVTGATGPRFLLDTAKSTEATVEHSFAAFLGVPAARRTVVIGRLYDFNGIGPAEAVTRVTDQALAVADEVVLYGHSVESATAATLAHPRVRSFLSARDLGDHVWSSNGEDDLVLVHGNYLARVALRATHDVRCWIDDCTRRGGCSTCPLVGPLLE